MKTILILGAGKSSFALIDYLLAQAVSNGWRVRVGDMDVNLAASKINNHPLGEAFYFNVHDEKIRRQAISNCDLVISLLPVVLHTLVAESCLTYFKPLITASYISPEQANLDEAFRHKKLLFMGEMGLDPGIDHMSLMNLISELQKKEVKITAIYSHCGALVHPSSDTNKWHYKFSWAPINVILAGQGLSQYRYKGKNCFIPYNRLFTDVIKRKVKGIGDIEIYANRNSIPYHTKYNIESVPTLLRGTIRYKGFCGGWNNLIKLGLTDHTMPIDCEGLTYLEWTKSFIPASERTNDAHSDVCNFLGISQDGKAMKQLEEAGLFSTDTIKLQRGTSAEILCELLSAKWKLDKGDKDIVIMLHEVEYEKDGKKFRTSSTLIENGYSEERTAIGKTVGLPAGILAKLLLTDKLNELYGVRIPTMPEVYQPVLEELRNYGLVFKEETIDLN